MYTHDKKTYSLPLTVDKARRPDGSGQMSPFMRIGGHICPHDD
jgi:hypothetical protein